MGRKLKIKIPVPNVDFVTFEAERVVGETLNQHETNADPHSQYTTEPEVVALITANAPVPRFATYWKWS